MYAPHMQFLPSLPSAIVVTGFYPPCPPAALPEHSAFLLLPVAFCVGEGTESRLPALALPLVSAVTESPLQRDCSCAGSSIEVVNVNPYNLDIMYEVRFAISVDTRRLTAVSLVREVRLTTRNFPFAKIWE